MESTWEATPNIAVVKYWGKRDNLLNLPKNGSISVTMDNSVRTVTSVKFEEGMEKDRLILNGREAAAGETARASRVLDEIRKKAGIGTRAVVESKNNFPTGAGIASSASGFAALACAASDAAGLKSTTRELSIFARLGSGSACRSVLGGFVEWKMGTRKGGSDSYAVQIAPASHWKTLRNVIAITDPKKKRIGSAEGMELTARTSGLYAERVKTRPVILKMMKDAILKRDLESFLELTMRESSHMHAVMMDSFPPIMYLNDVSREIIYAVHDFNRKKGGICAGYTFDAGPNAHIYTDEKYVEDVLDIARGVGGVQKTMVCGPGNGPIKLK